MTVTMNPLLSLLSLLSLPLLKIESIGHVEDCAIISVPLISYVIVLNLWR